MPGLREMLLCFLKPAYRRLGWSISFDMPEQCFPMCTARTGHVSHITANCLAPAARGIESIVFVMPQQHMDVLRSYLITGLVLEFFAAGIAFQFSLIAPQRSREIGWDIMGFDEGDEQLFWPEPP